MTPFVLDYDGQCKSICTQGFYAYQGICYMCNVECATCESMQICTSCSKGFALQENTCVKSCEIGFYESSGKCNRCGPNCLACLGT